MEQHTINVIEQCAQGSHEGTMRFPVVVGKLLEVGIAQYHADFLRDESTYYAQNGESHVVHLPMPAETIAQEFSAQGVAAAVKDSQQEKIYFPEFLSRAMEAGCIGYFVYLDGQRVIYYGRLAIHTPNTSPVRPLILKNKRQNFYF